MTEKKRNMTEYVYEYLELPFEPIQVGYRRRLVLDQIARIAPQSLLEIGCGELPLFIDLPPTIKVTVVEPAAVFAENARRLSLLRSSVRVEQAFIENFNPQDTCFDMIILSCVLHEVHDPAALLAAVRQICGPTTVLHVNVPNAYSLHRLLAVAMGLIPHPGAQSDTQRIMQQRATTYDINSLAGELKIAGFELLDQGSLFVKPFTHEQMQRLVDDGFMTSEMLDGFDKLVNWLPHLGSEIWTNSRSIR
jgi:SAM-dependent methyltransferase